MGTCVSCGRVIPDGQTVCSMCYGDPAYGKDGYYQAELDHADQGAEREEEERREREEGADEENA